MKDDLKKYDPPDLQLSGLQIWIHHRQFPDLEDYWDGNWINVTAHCEANGSSVQINGNFIHLSEIAGLMTNTSDSFQAQRFILFKPLSEFFSISARKLS